MSQLIISLVYAHGKTQQAKATMIKLHKDHQDPTDAFALHEFKIMQAQIDLEMQKKITTWQALQIPSVRRRFILGFLTMLGTQCSGLLVLLSMYSRTPNPILLHC
jgi:hypothetical protein